MKINKLINVLTDKLESGRISFLNEDQNNIYLIDDVFEIKATKEIIQDRHKIEIRELGTNEEFGFYGTVLTYQVQ
jgi:hypothetical protein